MPEMKSIHLSMKAVSRGKGAHICAKAAYAEKSTIHDDSIGKSYCYARKASASYSTTYRLGSKLPNGQFIDTAALWNMAEKAETRSNACTGRAMDLALPLQTSHAQNVDMLESLRGYMADRWGIASTIAIHYEHEDNPHAHILITSRAIDDSGHFGKKTRILDDRKTGSLEIDLLRQKWAELMNKAIPDDAPRWTHESHERRGVDRVPQIHLGATCKALLDKGIVTPRAEQNLTIYEINKIKADLEAANAELARLDDAIAFYESNPSEHEAQAGSQPKRRPDNRETQRTSGKPGHHDSPDQPTHGYDEHGNRETGRTRPSDDQPSHETRRHTDSPEAASKGHEQAKGRPGDQVAPRPNQPATNDAGQPLERPEPDFQLPEFPELRQITYQNPLFSPGAKAIRTAARLAETITAIQAQANLAYIHRAQNLAEKAAERRKMTEIPGLTSPDPVWPQTPNPEADHANGIHTSGQQPDTIHAQPDETATGASADPTTKATNAPTGAENRKSDPEPRPEAGRTTGPARRARLGRP